MRLLLPILLLSQIIACQPSTDQEPNSDTTTQPNIVFIMTDDHAKNAMSVYGSKLIETPNLDRIGKEGIVFNRSYVTNSICGPSRAVFLTGKYSHINGFKDNSDRFDGSQVTYPKILQKNNYYTAVVGKWHLKSVPEGFDYWNVLIGQGDYYNPTMVNMGDTLDHTGYTTSVITDLAIEVLDQKIPSDKPFCLMVHHKAPHRNWMPDSVHLALGEQRYPLPDNFYDSYENRPAAAQQDQVISRMFMSSDMKLDPARVPVETETGGSQDNSNIAQGWQRLYDGLTPSQKAYWDAYYMPISDEFFDADLQGNDLVEWKYQRYINDYLKCIMSVDDNVGRLLDYLEQAGQLDNTWIIYTSDQGFYLGEHGWYDKRFMYEESFGMPLVMRYPELIKPGTVNNNLVLNLDFAPTVMDLLQIPTDQPWQGQSILPLMKGSQHEIHPDGVYYHYYEYPHGWHKVKRHYGISTSRYKLIHFYHDIDHWELYDLQQDPQEMNNLYLTADPGLIQDLKDKLKKLQQAYGEDPANFLPS